MRIQLPKYWLILLTIQVLLSIVIFSTFLSGNSYFAYLDIGSDSYGQVVPYAKYLARTMAREGFTGWSFQIGLGGPTTAMLGDMFSLLSQSVGQNNVLSARILLYILKIVLGGAAFFLLIQCYVKRWESVVISALAYSFCGFMVINGQWDVEANAFVFYPLMLWAIVQHHRTGNLLCIPLAIAISLLFGVFFVSVGVFLVFTCAAFVALSDSPWPTFKSWVIRILPLTAIGYLMATPYLLPFIFQLMDSSRVSGGQSLIQNIFSQSFSINDWPLIFTEIGGIFHKDIFGIGSEYHGYWNYLEGPGFFIGVTLFLIIPQLWNGSKANRKALLFGAFAILAYFLFPVFRYSAMGFAVPYFRISTLWVSLILLLLAGKATDQIITKGVNGRLLAMGVAIYAFLLVAVLFGPMGNTVWMPHVFKILGLTGLSVTVLTLAYKKVLTLNRLPLVLIGIVALEAIVIARPSYLEGRTIVSADLRAYNDGTPDAIGAIRAIDGGIYRIEKTYHSVSLADALEQDYMGIKSYSLHSRGVVEFNIGVGLLEPTSTIVNFTNWLPEAGSRFMINSLLGVKYIISKEAILWPGFVEIIRNSNFLVYRNDMALPLGVVQTQQITKHALNRLRNMTPADANGFRDIAMLNAVVVDEIIEGHGGDYDLDGLLRSMPVSLQDRYFEPIKTLQQTGLHIDTFSNDHINGSISPTATGVLVFSIPFSQGWSLKVDGVTTPMFRANFGMLAAPVLAGRHSVELIFTTPGRKSGWILAALAITALISLNLRRRRHNLH